MTSMTNIINTVTQITPPVAKGPPVNPARRPDDEPAAELAKLTSHGELNKTDDNGSDDDDWTPPPTGGGVSAASPNASAANDNLSELLSRFEGELQKLNGLGATSQQVIEAARLISRTGLIIQTVRFPLESVMRDVATIPKSLDRLADEVELLRKNPIQVHNKQQPPTFGQRVTSLLWYLLRTLIIRGVVTALAIYGAINLAAPYMPMAGELLQHLAGK
jgi:hypothetical protein